jgi:hypothetical protein
MEFPDADAVDAVLDPVDPPPFAQVRYDPETPTLDGVPGATRDAVSTLPLDDLARGSTVAVGLGSRGITDIVTVAETVIEALRERDLAPVVVPAMGSHGGATPAGQTDALAGLGLTEDRLDCPIDARMETELVGESALGADVHLATSVLEADAVLVVNRVKPHTNFTGKIESGLSKMATVGLGKQPGAQSFHQTALVEGYVPTIETTLDVVKEAIDLRGGVAIVENFRDETARVEGVPGDEMPGAEVPLQADAKAWMPTLPFDAIDVLVVDRIGKDISGAGMDTNVIGRYRVLNADDPATPAINRIVARRLTEATHGNGNGVGLADVTTRQLVDGLDLQQAYTNALTSSSVEKAALPVVMPDDERAFRAAVSTIGRWDPETVKIAWIADTGHLSEFRVSPGLLAEAPEAVSVEGWQNLRFVDGEPVWEDREEPSGDG